MLFNSTQFLIFFPIVVSIYFLLPHRVRYIWLLLSSYYFYMCWNIEYTFLLMTSTIITYLSGILIQSAISFKQKKLWVALSFSINLAILFLFKYFDFAILNINRVLSFIRINPITPAFDVLLPVGISFYTFQALSYTVDVYRGEIKAEKNIIKYALFVSFFPQLVAGPIERSKNLLLQIDEVHFFDFQRMKSGLLLMLWGFFEKLVVADRVAILVNEIYNNYPNYAGSQILLATVLFAVQIYCDFSGYSDIAIGAAEIMGFRLMDNFKRPYFAISIKDFWSRWHISLSTWFRDYLYIPLGGNRCNKVRHYFNLMVTFLASGLWHGASWNFVVWGGLHGIYQVFGQILKPVRAKLCETFKVKTDCLSFSLLRILTTFILVDFAWIFFRAEGFKNALAMIQKIVTDFRFEACIGESLYAMGLERFEFWFTIFVILILFIMDFLRGRMKIRAALQRQNVWFRWIIYYAAILSVLVFGVYGLGYDASQFIYFQF